jgi:hypothetical protein
MLRYPNVQLAELRRIINDLLEHVEQINGPEVVLEQDYYWDLNSEAAYSVTSEAPTSAGLGSLGDDWEFLLNLRGGDIKQDGPSLMLVHAAPLLRYIGEKVGR